MKKAKSRLKKLASTKKFTKFVNVKKIGNFAKFNNYRKKQKKAYQTPIFLQKYLTHLPVLILSILFYFLVWRILTKVQPEQIQNFILDDSYLPILIPLLFANLFFFSFLLLKTRRGLLISILINILISLHLQKIYLTWQIGLSLCAFFAIIEIIAGFFNSRTKL